MQCSPPQPLSVAKIEPGERQAAATFPEETNTLKFRTAEVEVKIS